MILNHPTPITPYHPGDIEILFEPDELTGILTDKLIITLTDPRTPSRLITMQYGITASIVGQEMLEDDAQWSGEMDGTLEPEQEHGSVATMLLGEQVLSTEVPWTMPCAPYHIPSEIKAAVGLTVALGFEVPEEDEGGMVDAEDFGDENENENTNEHERLERILPPTLEPRTHAKFWHTLLYAEEVQAM